MAITDIIAALVLTYFLYTGWRKGIIRILIGPIVLIISIAVSVIYFNQTRDLPITFLILILGPILLGITWSAHAWLWKKNMDAKPSVSLLSHILGMIFNLFWALAIIAGTIMPLMLIPLPFAKFQAMQQDIGKSFTYLGLQKSMNNRAPSLDRVKNIVNVFNDPKKVQQLQSTLEFQKIADNPKIQDIVSDPQTMKEIQTGDIFKLMSNPRIQAITQDKKLMEELIGFSENLLKEKQ